MSKVLRKMPLDKQRQEINLRRDFEQAETIEDLEDSAEQQKANSMAEMEVLIKEAKAQAQQIISDADAKREEICREAQQQGYEEGFQKGVSAGRAEGQRLRSEAEELLAQARNWYAELIQESETKIIELATGIASKLVRGEMQTFPEHIVSVAQEAISSIKESSTYLIFANPQDTEMLRSKKDSLMQELPENVSLRILADQSITPGGCLLDTDKGQVEVTIEGQLDRLSRMLSGEHYGS